MLKSTNQPLSEAYSLALLDLDGVVYRGKNPVEHAAKNIRKAESLGMTVEYTTNNSSRLQAVVADQLKGFVPVLRTVTHGSICLILFLISGFGTLPTYHGIALRT